MRNGAQQACQASAKYPNEHRSLKRILQTSWTHYRSHFDDIVALPTELERSSRFPTSLKAHALPSTSSCSLLEARRTYYGAKAACRTMLRLRPLPTARCLLGGVWLLRYANLMLVFHLYYVVQVVLLDVTLSLVTRRDVGGRTGELSISTPGSCTPRLLGALERTLPTVWVVQEVQWQHCADGAGRSPAIEPLAPAGQHRAGACGSGGAAPAGLCRQPEAPAAAA